MRLLQSLSRGLQALDYLRAKKQAARLTDIASHLGLDKSNVAHLLKTLVASGYAQQDESRKYLAVDKTDTSQQDVHSLKDIIRCKEQWRPVLESLAKATGECAHLAVYVDSRVWYIDKVDSSLPLKVDHPIGSLSPLHSTALGKAFLAFGNRAYPQDMPSYTPKTITTVEALEHEISSTKTRGYAQDDEEFERGIRCVACPIHDTDNQMIAAIGVSGPTVRVDDSRFEELGNLVLSARNQQEAKQ